MRCCKVASDARRKRQHARDAIVNWIEDVASAVQQNACSDICCEETWIDTHAVDPCHGLAREADRRSLPVDELQRSLVDGAHQEIEETWLHRNAADRENTGFEPNLFVDTRSCANRAPFR